MPARSRSQQEAIAIALHEPQKLYKRNQGLRGMAKSDMHDFAATPTKGLPNYVKKPFPTPKLGILKGMNR